MTLQSLFVLLPSVISGGALAHLIWPDKESKSILFKLFFGIGLGLGINSLLFFIFLLLFGYRPGFFGIQITLMGVLVAVLIFRERASRLTLPAYKLPGKPQMVFLALAVSVTVFSSLVFATISQRKPQGSWDSWMIYNRMARFIYRGGEHWRDAFSPQSFWLFHADYPPMIALNVASGWDALGQETARIPILVGGAFLFASAGIMFAGVNAYKTIGQATLALLVLFSVLDFIESGARQVAEVPIAFFFLGTGILVFLYALKAQKGLLILAGLSAGLSAWTKNEGILFVLASLAGLGVAYRKEWRQILPLYLLGLAAPVIVLIYFKVALAPPGDLFVDVASQIRQATDPNRHILLLNQLRIDLASLVNWSVLVIYILVLGIDRSGFQPGAFLTCLSIILIQLIGYYSILLISPHDLFWHIAALSRLILQVGPLIVFLYFCAVKPPETIFQTR